MIWPCKWRVWQGREYLLPVCNPTSPSQLEHLRQYLEEVRTLWLPPAEALVEWRQLAEGDGFDPYVRRMNEDYRDSVTTYMLEFFGRLTPVTFGGRCPTHSFWLVEDGHPNTTIGHWWYPEWFATAVRKTGGPGEQERLTGVRRLRL